MKQTLRLLFSGFMMGSADTVPGVSGGTIAFLLGIYEELIYSIKLLSTRVLKLFLQGRFKDAWALIPFAFLLPLTIGLFTAIIVLAKGISYLLTNYPAFLWSFFFGLVVASVMIVKKRVVTWNGHDYLALTTFTLLAYIIVGAVPVETPANPIAFLLSGAIAICAMILPGISGSFLLVIMGKYEQILAAVTNRDYATIIVFMIGAIVGLGLFSQLLSWLFSRHHDIVIASLTGFMIGSLRKVWPWKDVVATRLDSHGELVPIVERNIFPNLDLNLIYSLALMLVGYLLIIILDYFSITKEQVKDIKNQSFVKQHKQSLQSQKTGQI